MPAFLILTPVRTLPHHPRREREADAGNTTMRMPSTKTVLFTALFAVAALPLTACVAPGYGPYGAQSAFPGQPQYAAPGYAQPGYVQPAYPSNSAPAYPSNTAPTYPANAAPAYPQQHDSQSGGQYGTPNGMQYGTVTNIRPIGSGTSPSGMAGTVVGALVGGVLGNQIGRGHGRDAATVIGALGGAYAGNQLGQQMGQPSSYRVDVQVSDGSMRAFDVQTPGDLHPGDHVRIDGSQLSRY